MRWGLLLIVAIALGMFTPGPAAAADPPVAKDAHPKDKKDAKGGHGGKLTEQEKENIELFKGWLDLMVWTIAVFVLLFLVLNTFAWPQIRAGLDKREAHIAHAHEEAKAAKLAADTARKELDAKMAEANDQIRTMIDKARADAQATASEELARGKAELAAEKNRLRDEMARARDQALQEIWTQGATLATLISAKTIRKQLTQEDHHALVEDALKEFRAAAQARADELTGTRA